MNPKAPHMHGTIKLHKEHKPIQPIVSWKDSSGYKLVKYITTQLNNKLQLAYACKIQHSANLIYNLKSIEIDENTELCSFNIETMITKIPVTEVKNNEKILDNDNHTHEKEKQTNNPIKQYPCTTLFTVQ
jgi:acetamidase/formamidase